MTRHRLQAASPWRRGRRGAVSNGCAGLCRSAPHGASSIRPWRGQAPALPAQSALPLRSMFDVRCSMFDVRRDDRLPTKGPRRFLRLPWWENRFKVQYVRSTNRSRQRTIGAAARCLFQVGVFRSGPHCRVVTRALASGDCSVNRLGFAGVGAVVVCQAQPAASARRFV